MTTALRKGPSPHMDAHQSHAATAAPGGEVPYTLVAADRVALLAAATTSEDGVTIQRIFHTDGVRLIRIAFAAGQVMREHSTNAPLLVQVLSGEIAFAVAGEVLDLHEGSVLFVRPGELHELTARTDAHVLLTLSTSHTPGAPGAA